MKRIELVLFFFCIFGMSLALEKSEQSKRHQRILNGITQAATPPPHERNLFLNPYLMSSMYNQMTMNFMGLGMHPYGYSPYSMNHMGGMMNPMASMMMMNPMYSMMNPMYSMMNPMYSMMMNPMMMGMMGMYNPMMGLMGGLNQATKPDLKNKPARRLSIVNKQQRSAESSKENGSQ